MALAHSSLLRAHWAGFKAVLAFTALTVVYTFVMTGIGQLGMPDTANGSLLRDGRGVVVGSSLVGQSFADAHGHALPQYFQSRPSAAGDGYDAAGSGASNLGHGDAGLIADVARRRDEIAAREGVRPADVPADALTASASGLDPAISPAYARIQVRRVARARGLSEETVGALVARHTTGRGLGLIGEPAVNVVTLNLALDELA